MRVSYDELRAQSPEDRLKTVLAEAKEHHVVGDDVSPDDIGRLIDVTRAHTRMLMEYEIVPFRESVHFFRPAETNALPEALGETLEADLGWSRIEGLQFVVETVPGDHFSMMIGDHARELAARLDACLAQAATAPLGG
jgi:myxalamid-type polyketide synthase MxaB